MTVLNMANGVYSGVQQCTDGSNDCVGNLILVLLYFMVITAWFAFLWLLAASAQDKRSRKLALLLMIAELGVAAVALMDAKHHSYVLGLVTSLVDAVLALWVAMLAFRLARAGGGRVTTGRKRLAARSDKKT